MILNLLHAMAERLINGIQLRGSHMPCAGHSFKTWFLDPEHIVLLDTASQNCCGFDLRAVFRIDWGRDQEHRCLVLFQVEKPEQQKDLVADWAFSDPAIKSRATARQAAEAMGATVFFVLVSTGRETGLAEEIKAREHQGENLIFLTGEALKAWMPVLACRPRLYTASP